MVCVVSLFIVCLGLNKFSCGSCMICGGGFWVCFAICVAVRKREIPIEVSKVAKFFSVV